MKAFVVKFILSDPLVLQHRLHLDAVLGSVFGGIDHLPIQRDSSGIFRCSQAMFVRPGSSGSLPYSRIQNVLNVETRRFLVDRAPDISVLPSKPDYATKSDTLSMWQVPSVRFLVETEDAGTLLAACREVPAIGKWSRKGNGSVASCTMEPFSGDVWSVSGKVTRALPYDMAASLGLTGVNVMEVCRPPYWSGEVESAMVPTFDPLDSYSPRLRNTAEPTSRIRFEMGIVKKMEVAQ